MEKYVFLYAVFKENKTDEEKREFWLKLAYDAGLVVEYTKMEYEEPPNISIVTMPIEDGGNAFFAGRISILSHFNIKICDSGYCFRDSVNLEYYREIIGELKAELQKEEEKK